jgi:Na+:H+ antiporter, NhaA family
MSLPARDRGKLRASKKHSLAVRKFQEPVQAFIHTQGSSGFLLVIAAVCALAWANSPLAGGYSRLWDATISFELGPLHLAKSLHHWINDGLMAIFFFLVGMEIKHELVDGELRSFHKASMPAIAAFGGMIVPALIFVAFNFQGDGRQGWAIPMATDIAFALGVLALVPGVPGALKVFLLALAIVDDIGAIAVIALFYTEAIHWSPLLISAIVVAVIWSLRRVNVQLAFPYVILGLLFWFCILKSGIHATIAGVILGFMVSSKPVYTREKFRREAARLMKEFGPAVARRDHDQADTILGELETLTVNTESPLERLIRQLHPWVSFLVIPIFALANAGVQVSSESIRAAIANPIAWGVFVGLVVGKPVGVLLFSWLGMRFKIGQLPEGIGWRSLMGVGVLAGIGFTVSIFVAGLAYDNAQAITVSKFAILCASLAAGLIGYVLLRWNSSAVAMPADEQLDTAKKSVPANAVVESE